MGYQNELQNNNIDLQTILNTVNELPEQKSLADLTADADATAADIANGKTAYVDGIKVTGEAEAGHEYEIIETAEQAYIKSYSVVSSFNSVSHFQGAPNRKINASESRKTVVGCFNTTAHVYGKTGGITITGESVPMTFDNGRLTFTSTDYINIAAMKIVFIK